MFWLLPILALLSVPQKAPPLTREWVVQAERGVNLDAALARYRSEGRPKALGRHLRYYQRDTQNGRDIVRAVYVIVDMDRGPGIYIEPLPHLFDGGCGVVRLTFDYRTRQLLSAYCNGAG
ncbi:hypothetical protein [Sphingomonas sp. OTU376]|uniref:hypothetical protein n=1 Tax=Sphingomonas sp. OTU376 TaxID=3043863 RepID=UPI00313ECA25